MTSAEDAAVTLGAAGGGTTIPARQELVLSRRGLAEDIPDPTDSVLG